MRMLKNVDWTKCPSWDSILQSWGWFCSTLACSTCTVSIWSILHGRRSVYRHDCYEHGKRHEINAQYELVTVAVYPSCVFNSYAAFYARVWLVLKYWYDDCLEVFIRFFYWNAEFFIRLKAKHDHCCNVKLIYGSLGQCYLAVVGC